MAVSLPGVGVSITSLSVSGITGLGTGVATALAVNIGSAGAFVVYGGVGSFTTLSASGLITASKNSAAQVVAYGWSTLGGASSSGGEILVGNNASLQGRIQYSQGGSVPFVIENTFADANAPVILKANGVNAVSATSTGVTAAGTLVLSAYGTGGTVSVGAADSGGAGFKLLRVPN